MDPTRTALPVSPLTAPDLSAWLADATRAQPLLLDVREPWEFETCHLDDAQLLPMRDIPARVAELDIDRPIVCICHHGARSMQVAMYLSDRGARDVHNLTGGVAAWAAQVNPAFPTY